jgi:hypothetical protein
MLNDIANMTLSYRNMVLYVCDRIGSIVLLLVLVHLVVLVSNCINNAFTTGFHSDFCLPPSDHPFVIKSHDIVQLGFG